MERVTINIEVNVDDKQLDALIAKLALLDKQASSTSRSIDQMANSSRRMDTQVNKNSRSVDKLSSSKKKLENASGKLSKGTNALAKIYKSFFSLFAKGVAINLAAGLVSILAVNAAFATGRVLVQAYHGAMTILSAGFASLAVVLTTVLAGQRQYNAALQSTRYGGSLREATAQLRNLQSNTQLAVFGAEALSGAFAAVSQKTKMTGPLNEALTSLGDFAMAGGKDPAKALQAAGAFLGELVSKGKITAEVAKAAGEVGPQLEKAVKDWQRTNTGGTAQEFLNALTGGNLSEEVKGQLDRVNSTLFGTFKRNVQVIKEELADFGQNFLPEATDALNQTSFIVKRTMLGIAPLVLQFGKGTFMEAIVSGMNKLSILMVRLVEDYLPKADGMFERIRQRMQGVGDFFERIRSATAPLQQGARVLMEVFGPFFKEVFKSFGRGVMELNDILITNKSGLQRFADQMLTLFKELAKFMGEFKQAVIQVLPVLNPILAIIQKIIASFNVLFRNLNQGGGIGSLVALAGVFAGYFGLKAFGKGVGTRVKGATTDRLQAKGAGPAGLKPMGAGTPGLPTAVPSMTVTAGSVYVNGRLVGGGGALPPPTGKPVPGMPPPGGAGVPAGGAAAGKTSRFRSMMSGNGAAMATAILAPLLGNYYSNGANGYLGGLGMGGNLVSGVAIAKMMGANSILGAGFLPAGLALAGGAVAGGAAQNLYQNQMGGRRERGTTAYSVKSAGIAGAAGAVAGGLVAGGAALAPTGIGLPAGLALAGLGLAAGAITGWVQAGKQKKAARNAARDLVGSYDEAINEALAAGDLTAANQLVDQLKAQKKPAAEASKQMGAFNKEFDKLVAGDVMPDVAAATDQFNFNMRELQDRTGLTSDAIKNMARETGVNLLGSIENFGSAVAQLRKQLDLTDPSQAKALIRQLAGGAALEAFQRPQMIAEQEQAVYQAGRGIEQKLQSGQRVTDADIGQYLETSLQYQTLQNGGDVLKALTTLSSTVLGPAGFMFGQGYQFEGAGKELSPRFLSYIGKALTGFAGAEGNPVGSMVSELQNRLLKQGLSLTDVAGYEQSLKTTISNVGTSDPTKLFKTLNTLTSLGNMLSQGGMLDPEVLKGMGIATKPGAVPTGITSNGLVGANFGSVVNEQTVNITVNGAGNPTAVANEVATKIRDVSERTQNGSFRPMAAPGAIPG